MWKIKSKIAIYLPFLVINVKILTKLVIVNNKKIIFLMLLNVR